MEKTVYQIVGFDKENREVLSAASSGLRPDEIAGNLNAIKSYLAGEYADWLAAGWSVLDSEGRRQARADWIGRVRAAEAFTVTVREGGN